MAQGYKFRENLIRALTNFQSTKVEIKIYLQVHGFTILRGFFLNFLTFTQLILCLFIFLGLCLHGTLK